MDVNVINEYQQSEINELNKRLNSIETKLNILTEKVDVIVEYISKQKIEDARFQNRTIRQGTPHPAFYEKTTHGTSNFMFHPFLIGSQAKKEGLRNEAVIDSHGHGVVEKSNK